MVLSFVRANSQTKREPLLRDFHMVGAGYDLKDEWQKLLEPRLSNGKRRTSDGGGTKMTYRYYLQDAFFSVLLDVPEDLAETLSHALQNPVWDLYLGRKNCVPTDFIYRGIFDSSENALSETRKIADEKNLIEDFRVFDGEREGDETFVLTDVPIQFGEHKQYRDRYVTLRYSHEPDNS
jgi:CRISPR system Cascade subunit CasD